MKSAFRVRKKQPDPNAADNTEATPAGNTCTPEPKAKGKGRGRGRRPKAKADASAVKDGESKQDAQPDQADASAGKDWESKQHEVEVKPGSPSKADSKRRVAESVQTPTRPSPNKKPSKRAAKEPASDEAVKELKDRWAVQDRGKTTKPHVISYVQVWALLMQEPLLREAGVPIPAEFDGSKKSFTLPAGDGTLAVGVLLLG